MEIDMTNITSPELLQKEVEKMNKGSKKFYKVSQKSDT